MSEGIELFPFDFGEFVYFGRLDVVGQVDTLMTLLADFGVVLTRPWDVPMADRGRDAVEDRFSSWGSGTRPTILYWVGHGWATSRNAALAHAKSPKRVGTKGIDPVLVAEAISAWEARTPASAWLLVIIDACKSARFAERLAAELDNLGGHRRIAILGTSTASSTNLDIFARELAAALQHTFAGNEAIPVTQLVDELRRTVRGERRVLNLDPGAVLRRRVPPVDGFTGPLDARAELDAVVRDLPEDERRHFLTKAQGGELRADSDMLGELTWHFTGRDDERHDVLARMESGDLVVVTGRAGSGKSAILGDLVVRSRPEVARVLLNHGLIEPILDQIPPLDAAIQLTGLDVGAVLSRLSAALGLTAPIAGLPLTAQIDDLTARLDTRPTARVVVDALDEAIAPLQVAAALRRIAAINRVDLTVGTRRSTHEGPDLVDPADRDLLDALGVAEDETVRVERRPQLAFRYVRDRLRPLVAAGHLSNDQVTAAARAVAGVDQEFLYARLATYELLAHPELVLTPDLVARIGPDHRSIFAGAVARLTKKNAQYRPLLIALALAQGRGLPIRDGVWAAVASAIGGRRVSEQVIHQLLDDAAPYLALDLELGQTVYRLAHRPFAEHLTEAGTSTTDRHAKVVERALQELTSHGERSNPYWLHHTSSHCAAVGRAAWHELDRSPVLDLLHPDAVAGEAMRTLFGRGPIPANIAAGLFAASSFRTVPPAERLAARRLARARVAGIAAIAQPPDDQRWWPVWAVTQAQPVHANLTGHVSRVNGVAAVPLPDGRTLLASAGDDGSVRLWDPSTGQPVGDPLTSHTSGVTAVAAVPLPDGRTLLASARDDGSVQLWDPSTGQPVGDPLTSHTSWMNDVAAVPLPDGRTLLAFAGDDKSIRLWDPSTGQPVGDPLTGHTSWVNAVAVVPQPDGQTLLASGSNDQTVRLWDPTTGQPVGDPLTGHTGGVSGVAAVPLPDGRTLLASASYDGTLRLWNPSIGQPFSGPLIGHTDVVLDVAAVPLPDGRILLASAGNDGSVRLWDPSTGQPVGDPLTGHTIGVSGVAAVPLPDGRTLLASAGNDGSVRLWDPSTGQPVGDPTTGHADVVTAVAAVPLPDGRTLLASASNDQTVRLWDPSTGQPVGEPLTGHVDGVSGVAAVPLPDGRTLLASAGDDGSVRLWDPSTGQLVGDPLTGDTSRVTAVAALPLPDGRTLLASAGDDGSVQLWDPSTGQLVGDPLTGDTSGVTAVAAVPLLDGRTLLASAGDDGSVRLWDPSTGQLVGDPLTGDTSGVTAVAAVPLPDGRTLLASAEVAGDNGSVRLWDPSTGQPVGDPLTGHTSLVNAVAAVSMADGRTLLGTAGDDETVRLWDIRGASLITIWVGASVHGLAPTGPAHLAVAMDDGLTVIALGESLIPPA
jgi:WD40 repeat protein